MDATKKNTPFKRLFPDTLYVMEPHIQNANPDDDQDFNAYSGTKGGEDGDHYAVYELMGFVRMKETKEKILEDI